MKVEITTETEAARSRHVASMLRQFVEDNIAALQRHQDDESLLDERSAIVWKKYCASLWMVGCRLGIYDESAVAASADVPADMVRSWKKEKNFSALVAHHYREFLELVIAVLT